MMAAGGGKRRKKRSFTLQNEHEEMEIYEATLLKASEKFH